MSFTGKSAPPIPPKPRRLSSRSNAGDHASGKDGEQQTQSLQNVRVAIQEKPPCRPPKPSYLKDLPRRKSRGSTSSTVSITLPPERGNDHLKTPPPLPAHNDHKPPPIPDKPDATTLWLRKNSMGNRNCGEVKRPPLPSSGDKRALAHLRSKSSPAGDASVSFSVSEREHGREGDESVKESTKAPPPVTKRKPSYIEHTRSESSPNAQPIGEVNESDVLNTSAVSEAVMAEIEDSLCVAIEDKLDALKECEGMMLSLEEDMGLDKGDWEGDYVAEEAEYDALVAKLLEAKLAYLSLERKEKRLKILLLKEQMSKKSKKLEESVSLLLLPEDDLEKTKELVELKWDGNDFIYAKTCYIINEILQTEHVFMRNLGMYLSTFFDDLLYKQRLGWTGGESFARQEKLDIHLLSASVYELRNFSMQLYTELSGCVLEYENKLTNASDFGCFCEKFAYIFQESIPLLKKLYGNYCGNMESIENLEFIYAQKAHGWRNYFEECQLLLFEAVPGCISMNSFYMKPLQRLLKYPLFFRDLAKDFDKHFREEDKQKVNPFNSLAQQLSETGNEINELKRGRDIVAKYMASSKLKNDDIPLSPGNSPRINHPSSNNKFVHSLKKMTNRGKQKLFQLTGVAQQSIDYEFEAQRMLFLCLAKRLKLDYECFEKYCVGFRNLALSLSDLIANMRLLSGTKDNTNSLSMGKSEVNLTAYQVEMERYTTSLFVKQVEPFKDMLKACRGPRLLIDKRDSKLLDYDQAKQKASKEKGAVLATEKEFAEKEKVYQALNSQLVEEIPIFVKEAMHFYALWLRGLYLGRMQFMMNVASVCESCEGKADAKSEDILRRFFDEEIEVVSKLNELTLTPSYFKKVFETSLKAYLK
eukprot:Nk52_evm4s262 gene=Nk52_evmTU4s262